MDENSGVFTLSLDTELAWGTFDANRIERYEAAYRRTPEVIDRLCALLDEYRVPATWAVVSHLLVDCGGDHAERTPPEFSWVDDWFGSLPCSSGLDRDLWYAPWLIDRIRSCKTDHEIGLHGATHMQLGAEGCSRRNARAELEMAVATLREFGVHPESFVFPRNDVGHLDVLAECGLRVYRGVDARWYEQPPTPDAVKPPLRFIDEATRRTPPVVEPTVDGDLVNVPGSQPFRPRWGGWKYTPPGSSAARAERGLRRAARTGKVFHLWFHPFNLAGNPDAEFRRLERVLETASELVADGSLVVRPMRDAASMMSY
jgi:peptidoglycan/xylan/chitin deacetylase (PgdA/CDA1 family)